MSYEPSGELTTDEREVGTSETWDTQAEWEQYQSKDESVTIENGVVRLAEQAFFAITISGTNSPVTEGDVLTVSYDVDNTGEVSDTQDIRLEIESVQEDVDQDVTVAGGASTSGTLQWDTTGESPAEYSAVVLSDDDSDSVTVVVESAIPDSGNLHMRYDAVDQSATDGDAITTLSDQTGNGNDLTGNATYNATGLNGKPTFDLDGTDDKFSTSSLHATLSEPQTIYLVYRLDDTNSSNNHLGFSREGSDALSYITNGGGSDEDTLRDVGSSSAVRDGATDYGTPHILCGRIESDGTFLIERDDTSASTGSGTSGSYNSFAVAEDVYNSWDGAISAAWVYNAAHDSTTRSDVFSELKSRYGF